jgi:hypothetical protein
MSLTVNNLKANILCMPNSREEFVLLLGRSLIGPPQVPGSFNDMIPNLVLLRKFLESI